jgi:hypothetical protein
MQKVWPAPSAKSSSSVADDAAAAALSENYVKSEAPTAAAAVSGDIDVESFESFHDYLSRTGVSNKLNDAFVELAEQRPDDATGFVSRALADKSGSGSGSGSGTGCGSGTADFERAMFFGAFVVPAVQAAAQSCAPCALKPVALFGAWSGVLTLVYEGFPPPLAALKSALNTDEALRSARLAPENFGSRWPKTSLAVLADEGTALTLKQLEMLRDLCGAHGARLAAARVKLMAGVSHELSVPVTALAAVRYSRRGLEGGLAEAGGALEQRVDVALGAGRLVAAPAPTSGEERERVRGVVKEWDDLPAYLGKFNQPGSRAASYREGSPAGATLVAFLSGGTHELLFELLSEFRVAVDDALPGVYRWLDTESLHCTVRALDQLEQ